MTTQNKMTKEDFLELYGHISLSFNSYYKYQFSFLVLYDIGSGALPLLVNTLGVRDYIYRTNIKPQMTIEELYKALPIKVTWGSIELFENWSDEGY